MQNNVNIQNKRARFEYEILDKYIAGIVLRGTEIKSIRLGKASIAESFCEFNEKSEATPTDDNGTATDGAHWQLHWRLHGHGDELYLRLDASGDYQPAYLDNLRVTLPPNETRRLIISGNIDVQQT